MMARMRSMIMPIEGVWPKTEEFLRAVDCAGIDSRWFGAIA